MSKNIQFEKNKRAHDLYINKPLFKSLLTILTPGLVMNLMTGIYIFTSQVLITRLAPIAHGSNIAENFTHWFNNIDFQHIKSLGYTNPVGDTIKGAMSISSPLITIIASSPFFLAGGATVVFTQAMGKKNRYKANEIFKTSFWMVICLAILEIIILLSINKPVLTAMSPKSETTTDPILQDFFNQEHALQIKFAREYTLIYSIGIFLPLLMFYFASLVKSEGRFRLVVITSIVCNVLNIGCIIFFILVAKIDMYGGALGSTISYTINLTTILVYIGFLNKKNDTWLSFKVLFKKGESKIVWNLILPIILVGLSSFLIDLSYAIANMAYIPLLAKNAEIIYLPAQGNTMYFQTLEGAIMPTLNFVFVTIYGIIDGARTIVAYNYANGNWKRIKNAYHLTMLLTFAYSMFMFLLIAVALGKPILQLFDVNQSMLNDGYKTMLIQLCMVPIFSLQVSAMSIYMAIGDIVKSNISAIFQDTITFFPIMFIMLAITKSLNNIWLFVATYVINAFIATLIMVIFTEWWIKKRFGKIKTKKKVNGVIKTEWIQTNKPKPSYIERMLNKVI